MVHNDADWMALLDALKKFKVVSDVLEPSAYYTNQYLASKRSPKQARQELTV